MVVKKKEPTAFEKAKAQYDKDKENYKKWQKKASSAYKNYKGYQEKAKKAKKGSKKKSTYTNLATKWKKTHSSAVNRREKAKRTMDKSKAKYDKLQGKIYEDNKSAVADKIANQRQGWHNEGTAAIYRTDGHSENVVFISPGDGESEDTQATVTSYAVDQGSPRSNYARTNSKTVQVAGIITGETRSDANKKWALLRYWLSRHTELTYKGSFTYHHLILSDAQQSFTTMRDNLKVSLTFTFVYAAEITISTGKNAKTKKSKSSKTTAGTRNKNYTAITIKPGDTLWGLSQKYGKSVAWLQKVNNIKNPNLIYAGRTLYVSEKEKKKSKKMRVK